MVYEVTLSVDKLNEKGEPKRCIEKYITDKMLFAEAEAIGLALYNNECDVTAIKRSKISEIINNKEEDKPFFKAVVCTVITNDDGSEKEVDSHILVCEKDVKSATEKVVEYAKRNFGMELKSISRTKILDFLK
mgnify:CR=1 FL=1